MYYRSGTAKAAALYAGQTLRKDSPDGGTLLREMTSWPPSWNRDVKSKVGLRQSMRYIYLQEHSWQISSRSDLKRRSLGLFWRGRPNKNNNKTS